MCRVTFSCDQFLQCKMDMNSDVDRVNSYMWISTVVKQGEAVIAISFFNQPYLVDKIEMGAEVAIFGKWDQKKSAVTGMKVLAQVEDDMQP